MWGNKRKQGLGPNKDVYNVVHSSWSAAEKDNKLSRDRNAIKREGEEDQERQKTKKINRDFAAKKMPEVNLNLNLTYNCIRYLALHTTTPPL